MSLAAWSCGSLGKGCLQLRSLLPWPAFSERCPCRGCPSGSWWTRWRGEGPWALVTSCGTTVLSLAREGAELVVLGGGGGIGCPSFRNSWLNGAIAPVTSEYWEGKGSWVKEKNHQHKSKLLPFPLRARSQPVYPPWLWNCEAFCCPAPQILRLAAGGGGGGFPWFRLQLCRVLALWTWASYSVLLILGFFFQLQNGDYSGHKEPLGLFGGWNGIIQMTWGSGTWPVGD